MTLTSFWVILRRFTCSNFQRKHKNLVDPKQTVGARWSYISDYITITNPVKIYDVARAPAVRGWTLAKAIDLKEVKVKYRQLSEIYHPDKHQPDKTGVSEIEAHSHFQKSTTHKSVTD